MAIRLCDSVGRGPDSCRIFRPFTRRTRKKIRVQMPQTDNQRRRPRMARQRARLPPNVRSTAFFNFSLISLNGPHRYNTFASAGSDGTVSIWDHKVKKRLRQYPKFPNPVSAIAFNCDGTKIAVGASYTWDEGEEGLKHVKTPWLGVRRLGDEVKVGVGRLLCSNCGADVFHQ